MSDTETHATAFPGGTETAADAYDGIDQDCAHGDLVDVDGDLFNAEVAGGTDCDDTNPDINIDATDIPDDGIDQDCSGADTTTDDTDDTDTGGEPEDPKCGCNAVSGPAGLWGLTLLAPLLWRRRRSFNRSMG